MPVSFPVAQHAAKPFSFPYGGHGHTAKEVLAMACKDQHTKAGEILQFSLPVGGDTDDGGGRNLKARIPQIVPNANGFVATLLDAYTQDRALVIRPDDVWLAILSQFNFFVNARAELLRASFVSHRGKKELLIDARPQTFRTIDLAHVARQMADLVGKNVVDTSLRAWATPDFTTTTINDTTVSAVLLMATLKHYFEYKLLAGGCGIPRVTLEGQRSDWVNILTRLEKLKEYELETIAWYHLLRPVIARFVAAFDKPTSPYNVDFWQRVAHYKPGGSGMGDYYTGWIIAFAPFSKEGQWLGHTLNKDLVSSTAPETLGAIEFWETYGNQDMHFDFVLDGTPYHRLSGCEIPPGYAEVGVKVADYNDGKTYDCAMVAGSVGLRVTSSGDRSLSPSGENDTVRPLLGWWMYIKDEDKDRADERAREAYRQKYGSEPYGRRY
ncbi:hypothetical protein B0H16DRAFT_1452540 [Mycena metata]|uniref:DUF4419 domain-containing protein n=1 Tax=Mycena metata TaxID=1033252 RepID=A0AAD7JTQ2_9AGAR|nr:hypothetical protein B0H16DRAFT_1452540 [Mycena metata]